MGAFHPFAVVHIAVLDSMFVYFTPCHKCRGEIVTSGLVEGGKRIAHPEISSLNCVITDTDAHAPL